MNVDLNVTLAYYFNNWHIIVFQKSKDCFDYSVNTPWEKAQNGSVHTADFTVNHTLPTVRLLYLDGDAAICRSHSFK